LHQVDILLGLATCDLVSEELRVEHAFTADADGDYVDIVFAEHWVLQSSGKPLDRIVALKWRLDLSLSALFNVLEQKCNFIIDNGFLKERLVHIID
jgi:hypothetical protein|tara:strand:- start:1816 stop:2103 length:288 start_codon:yes stop_codon:yes gene_type:complete